VIVLDVNVLVAAYLTGHQFHAPARRFLRAALAAGDFAIPDAVWSGFARVVTNPALVQPPASWPEVREFAGAVSRRPGYRADVRGATAPIGSFLALCQATGARRNLVSDACLAAVAIDHNASVATWDADFDAFPVPVVHPPLSDSLD